jgi:hypothetical protein
MFKNGMRAVHPGEVLREDFLKPLSMSANALAKALSVHDALKKCGRPWTLLDINALYHAANFSLGLSPALDANRTSMSKLN